MIIIFASSVLSLAAIGHMHPQASLELVALPSGSMASNEAEMQLIAKGDAEHDEYVLYALVGIGLDSKGNIFLLDIKQNCIFKFDAEGNYVKTFGMQGGGPGEMSVPNNIFVDSQDQIVVYEIANRRFSIFNNEGEFIKSTRFDNIVWNFKIDPKGRYYIETRIEDFQNLDRGTLVKISRYSQDLSSCEPVDSALIKENLYISKPKFINVPVPFHPDLCWDLTPKGGIVVGFSSDYTVRSYSPGLEIVREWHHEGKRMKVGEKDKEEHFGGFLSVIDGYETREVPAYIRKATKFPKLKPFFNCLFIDANGHVLVSTYERTGDKVFYDVFDSRGKFAGKRALPAFSQSAIFKGNFVYDLVGIEGEIPSLVRYNLDKY